MTTFRDYPLTYEIAYTCGCRARAVSPDWDTLPWATRCQKFWHRRSRVANAAPLHDDAHPDELKSLRRTVERDREVAAQVAAYLTEQPPRITVALNTLKLIGNPEEETW